MAYTVQQQQEQVVLAVQARRCALQTVTTGYMPPASTHCEPVQTSRAVGQKRKSCHEPTQVAQPSYSSWYMQQCQQQQQQQAYCCQDTSPYSMATVVVDHACRTAAKRARVVSQHVSPCGSDVASTWQYTDAAVAFDAAYDPTQTFVAALQQSCSAAFPFAVGRADPQQGPTRCLSGHGSCPGSAGSTPQSRLQATYLCAAASVQQQQQVAMPQPVRHAAPLQRQHSQVLASCLPHMHYLTPPAHLEPAQPLAPRLGSIGAYCVSQQQQQCYQPQSATLHLAALLEQQQRQQQAAAQAKALQAIQVQQAFQVQRALEARYAAALAKRAQQTARLAEAHQQAMHSKGLALAQQMVLPAGLDPAELAVRWSQGLALQRLETPRLALHLWNRVRGRVNLEKVSAVGAAQPRQAVLVGCLWIAAKHEECRRGVPPASKIAPLAGVSPKLLGVLEIHLLQLLSWRPLYGWIGRVMA